MNIFYLHDDPYIAAQFHCDKHCVKMILESAQLLSTAHRLLDGGEKADLRHLYKSFSPKHPSAIWVRESHSHYTWLYDLMEALCDEYTRRYEKIHAVESTGLLSRLLTSPANIPLVPFTPPPQCMPDEYKTENTIQAYRNYYHGDKARFAEWRLGKPAWWKGAEGWTQSLPASLSLA